MHLKHNTCTTIMTHLEKQNWGKQNSKDREAINLKKLGQTNIKHKEKHFEKTYSKNKKKYTKRDPVLAAILKTKYTKTIDKK